MLVRLRELRPHHQCLDPACEEEGGRREEIEKTDALVIDGRQPAEYAWARQPSPLELLHRHDLGPGSGYRHQCNASR